MSGDAEDILARIDAVIGPPEEETEAEHDKRREMIERDHKARAIRRQSDIPPE